MERQSHDESIYQPSLFSYVNPIADEETNTDEETLEGIPHPTDYYVALDRLLDAIEMVLHSGYPLSDELHQRLSSPILEILIFDEMTRSLKLE